jgi:S1-C subfamily serine protease
MDQIFKLVHTLLVAVFLTSVLGLAFWPTGAQAQLQGQAEATDPADAASAPNSDRGSVGTGFFVTDSGLLVTAYHVVANYNEISVVMPGLRRLRAQVIKMDAANDIALLKVSAMTPFLYLSHSQGVPPGMDVVTVGYPQVGIQGFAAKITRGIVNSSSGMRDDPGSFQFSAEVQKGNSGGPLMGPGGTVVGVVRSKLDALKLSRTTNDLTQNVNYATKSVRLLEFLGTIPGLPTTRPVDADQVMRAARIYTESREAIVPVIARNVQAP